MKKMEGRRKKRQEIAEGKILGACVTLCVYVWVCGYVSVYVPDCGTRNSLVDKH